jgi:hypothetical protein
LNPKKTTTYGVGNPRPDWRQAQKLDNSGWSHRLFVMVLYWFILIIVPSPFMTCHRDCNKSNTTGHSSRTWTANPSGAHEFIHPTHPTPGCYGVRVVQSLVFCVLFCRSLSVFFFLFSFDHCIVCFFFDLWLLITSLV